MTCPKCGNANIQVQMVSEAQLKKKHHGVIYWLLFGWWFHMLMWTFLTLPMLIIKIFRPAKYKIKTTSKPMAVCQSCGHSWEIKKAAG